MSIKSNYYKERKRIERYIKRLERAGAEVEFNVPNIPKRITSASVSRLQKITPDKILAKTTAISAETGEIVSGRAILGSIQRREVYRQAEPVETKEQRERRKKAEWDEYYRQHELQQLKRETSELIKKNAKEIQTKVTTPKEYYPEQEEIIFDNAVTELFDSANIDEIDSPELRDAIGKLESYEPPKETNRWYQTQKLKQVNKLLKGIKQSISNNGMSAVAKTFEENAISFNKAIDNVVNYPSELTLDESDLAIDELINSLMGAMSYEDAEFYGE